jgi:hypothetical protein
MNQGGRFPNRLQHTNALAVAKRAKHGAPFNKRARNVERNQRLPFMPPEDWHEPHELGGRYKIIVQNPGTGFRHVLTPADVRNRLAQLPERFTRNLEVVQFSRMTRKKASFPCYGMQWGTTIYLYPIEENLVEDYENPPKPGQFNEARMYGGVWTEEPAGWKLVWSEATIRDFYLNNILIHELGHLVDDRNTQYQARERYAEWFAVEHGYKPSRLPEQKQSVHRRHHAKSRG